MKRRITVTLSGPAFDRFLDICEAERHRSAAAIAALIMESGMRVFRRKHNLLCDYPNCARKDCCGSKVEANGNVISFLHATAGPLDAPLPFPHQEVHRAEDEVSG